MGYYVHTTDINVRIPAENLENAYQAMCELNARDDLKYGARLGDNSNTGKPESSTSVANNPDVWFAWMPWNYDEEYKTAEEILSNLGFDTYTDNDGNLHLLSYDSKAGAEEYFLEAIAPYVEEGSYIQWQGEDGELCRNEFIDGEMVTYNGEITWNPSN